MSLDDLEAIREEIKSVTIKIFRLTGQRMELSRRIGEVKRNLGLGIEAPEVEDRLRDEVIEECRRIGLSRDLALAMLDLILEESAKIQRIEVSEE